MSERAPAREFVTLPGGRARINWMRDGLAGITYVDGSNAGGSQVVAIDEIRDQIAQPLSQASTASSEVGAPTDLRSLSIEELKAKLRELRERRLPTPQPKTRRRATTPTASPAAAPSMPTSSTVSKHAAIAAALSRLSDEERTALLNLLGMKGGRVEHDVDLQRDEG